MALTDLTRISTSGIATGTSLSGAILHGDAHFRGTQVGVTSALFDSSQNELNFKDNVELTFGNATNGDLRLYHDGSHSHIFDNGTGDLRVTTNGAKIDFQKVGGEVLARFITDGSNELYYNNSRKFQTTQSGSIVTGILTATGFSGPLSNPSGISTFYDLRVTNNLTVEGSTSTLDTTLIGVDRVEVGANSNSIVGVAVTQSGTADLVNLFDGATKVVTVDDVGNVGLGSAIPSTKLDVNGTSQFQDDITILGTNPSVSANKILFLKSNNTLRFFDSTKADFGQSGDLQIYHLGGVNYIDCTTSAQLLLQSDDLRIRNAAGNQEIITTAVNGNVQLFYSGNQKFTTTNTGVTVTGDVAASANISCVNLNPTGSLQIDDSSSGGNLYIGNNSDLKLFHNGSTNFIRSGAGGHTIQIDNNSGVVGAKFKPAGAVELYHNGTQRLVTTHNSVNITGNLNVSQSIGFDSLLQCNGDVNFNGDNYNIVFDKSDSTFEFADNAKLRIGDGNHFQIFHDGTDTRFTNNSNQNIIKINASEDIELLKDTGIAENLFHIGDTDTKIRFPSNDQISFETGGSERVRIDNAGNLLIDTTGVGNASTYARNIVISGSSNNGITIHTTDTSGSSRKCCIFFGTGTSVADMADGMIFYDHAGKYMHFSTDGAGTGITKSSIRLAGDGTVRFDSTPTDANSISLLIKSHKARAVNDNNGILFRDAGDHSQAAMYVQKKSTSNGTSDLVFALSTGQVVTTLQGIPEKLRLTSAGLLLGGSDASNNTTLGGNAGDSIASGGTSNTLIGKDAGTAITTGDSNTAYGFKALYTISTNAGCVAVGSNALQACTGADNIGVGFAAGQQLAGGTNNCLFGSSAGLSIQEGDHNVAIGRDALRLGSNSNVNNNVVAGSYSLNQLTNAYNNVVIGYNCSGSATMTGGNTWHSNVVIGYQAGNIVSSTASNIIIGKYTCGNAGSSHSNNIVMGEYAGQYLGNSSNNNIIMGQQAAQYAGNGSGSNLAYSWVHSIAIGYRAFRNATGAPDATVAIGSNALREHNGDGDASSGGYIVAMGQQALSTCEHMRHSVAIGNDAGAYWNPVKGQQHEGGAVFVGGGAGRYAGTAPSPICVGRNAGNASSSTPMSGAHNVCIGSRSLEKVSSGSNNTAVGGNYAALFVQTGSWNVFMGSLAGYGYDTTNACQSGNYCTQIGAYSKSSGASNDYESCFGYGITGKGANTTHIRGSAYNSNNSSSWSTTSDERIKKNIVDNNIGLDAIEKIRVRNFEYRTKNEITDFDNADSVVVKKEGVQLGVIAQEIKEILPDVVKQNTTGAYAVDPDNLTWYLVNAVKELSAEVKSLKAQLNS